MDFPKGLNTPWGRADSSDVKAKGIVFYGTPSHGGFHLSKERQEEMPEILRLDGPWYEEDVDWARVATAFPQFFSEKEKDDARETLRNWSPDVYEKFYKETIPEGQSYIKDKNLFQEKNRNEFVVNAAVGDWHEGVPKGMVLVSAKRESDDVEKRFLVSDKDYENRGRHSYVIKSTDQETTIAMSPKPNTSKFSRKPLLVTRGANFQQESYETGSPEIKDRAKGLRKRGYTVVVSPMGDQVTPVGRLKLTMITVSNPDDNLEQPEQVEFRS